MKSLEAHLICRDQKTKDGPVTITKESPSSKHMN